MVWLAVKVLGPRTGEPLGAPSGAVLHPVGAGAVVVVGGAVVVVDGRVVVVVVGRVVDVDVVDVGLPLPPLCHGRWWALAVSDRAKVSNTAVNRAVALRIVLALSQWSRPPRRYPLVAIPNQIGHRVKESV